MDIRRNHRDLTPEQKQAFVTAILILKNDTPSVLRPGQQGRYDDFVQIHKNSMGRGNPIFPNPHRNAIFFPWHRILIRQFELELQAAAQNPNITLPYWNWSTIGADDPFTDSFMGSNGVPAQNQRVMTGPFAFEQRWFRVNVWDGDGGDLGLRRQFGQPGTFLPSAPDVENGLRITPYWSVPNGWENNTELMHNEVHSWVGGNMGEASSPNDPIFFLHHCYLDRLWERWKQLHPTEPVISFAQNASNGMLNSTLIFNPDNEPAPWAQSYTVEQTLSTEGLDYRYADI